MKERFRIEVLDKETGRVQKFHVHNIQIHAKNHWVPAGFQHSVNVGQHVTMEFANPRTVTTMKTKKKKKKAKR